MDDALVAPWRMLLLAQNAVLRAIEAEMAGAGVIPLNTYDVLLELNSAPQRRLRMSELAARVVLSRTRVSRLVDDLVASGYVERVEDPSDGRAALAVITASGRRELRRAAPHYLAGIDAHFTALLTERERSVLVGALGRIVEHHAGRRPTRR